MREDLRQYYEDELRFLRRMGEDFAEKYPKIASRLVLEPNKCEDPHVERLLEGFALLAARVHLKIDDEFPEITEALLNILFPHYLRPIPSMSVVEFHVDSEQVKPESGLKIDRGAILSSRPVGGAPCKFRTGYDVTFWPVEVTAVEWKTPDRFNIGAGVDAAGALRVELRCHGELTFSRLAMRSLRFFLNAEGTVAHTLYEVLDNNCVQIQVREAAPKSKIPPLILSPDALHPVGFDEDEALLPYPRRSFAGYQLLQEYFQFPEKFLFLDLNLEGVAAAGFGPKIEIIFLTSQFERSERRTLLESQVSAGTFRLNCSPVINLFPQTAEPIMVDHTRYEYAVVPDVSRRTALEVFSIENVVSARPESEEVQHLEPLYSFRHSSREKQLFWYARRVPSSLRNDAGTELYLAISNLGGPPNLSDAEVLTVRSLCTNRDLPARLPFGNEAGDFTLESAAPVKRIVALIKPTPTVRPPNRKNLGWRLLSQLSLNYLSLVEDGLESLREILRLYNFAESAHGDKQIEGMVGLASKPHFAPVVQDHAMFFARGTRVEMEFDEGEFAGEGVYLFATVLDRFLGQYVSLNSFTQLLVKTRQRKEVLRLWPPRAGRKVLV